MDQRLRWSMGSSSSGEDTFFEGLVPHRAPTTVIDEETRVGVADFTVRLKVDAGPGCGGITWRSAEILSRYLAHRHKMSPQYLVGKTVLDLGSGTGLVGIAAAKLEPSADVWVSDQTMLLDLLRVNVDLNEVKNVHVAELSWGEGQEATLPPPDLVLAADCVYLESTFPLLITTLCELAPFGKEIEILFCSQKRRNADKRFFTLLKKHFESEIVEDDPERGVYNRQAVTLLRLRRRQH